MATTASDGAAPLVDGVRVDPGFEAALGAAFGDDLDAPMDEAAPAHWRTVGIADADPPLPQGVVALTRHVEAPAVLARRLAQTGVVDAASGGALQVLLRPGQRLVSREGDLWRWDGFVAAAHAPGSATQRLASRNRLAELDRSARNRAHRGRRRARRLQRGDRHDRHRNECRAFGARGAGEPRGACSTRGARPLPKRNALQPSAPRVSAASMRHCPA